jgi:hypothetical protein
MNILKLQTKLDVFKDYYIDNKDNKSFSYSTINTFNKNMILYALHLLDRKVSEMNGGGLEQLFSSKHKIQIQPLIKEIEDLLRDMKGLEEQIKNTEKRVKNIDKKMEKNTQAYAFPSTPNFKSPSTSFSKVVFDDKHSIFADDKKLAVEDLNKLQILLIAALKTLLESVIILNVQLQNKTKINPDSTYFEIFRDLNEVKSICAQYPDINDSLLLEIKMQYMSIDNLFPSAPKGSPHVFPSPPKGSPILGAKTKGGYKTSAKKPTKKPTKK